MGECGPRGHLKRERSFTSLCLLYLTNNMLHSLLAEDNEGDVMLVEQALEEHLIDHQLHVVKDGDGALGCVAATPPLQPDSDSLRSYRFAESASLPPAPPSKTRRGPTAPTGSVPDLRASWVRSMGHRAAASGVGLRPFALHRRTPGRAVLTWLSRRTEGSLSESCQIELCP